MRVLTPPTRSAPPPLGMVSPVAEGTHARGTAFNWQWGQGNVGGRGWRRATAAVPAAGERAFSRPAHSSRRRLPQARRGGAGGGARMGGDAAERRCPGVEPLPAPRLPGRRSRPRAPPPPPEPQQNEPGRAPQTAARSAAPTAEKPTVGPVAPEPGGRAGERASERGRRPRHLASPRPARFPGPESRPARRRSGAACVRPFRRFEFSPARRVRRNTRMVIAGLFAPILKKAERSSAGASQSAGLLPSFRARSQHLPRKSRGFFLLAQLGGPECSAEAAY